MRTLRIIFKLIFILIIATQINAQSKGIEKLEVERMYLLAIESVRNYLSYHPDVLVNYSLNLNVNPVLTDSVPNWKSYPAEARYNLIDVSTGKVNNNPKIDPDYYYLKYYYNYDQSINNSDQFTLPTLIDENGINVSFSKIYKEDDYYHAVIWFESKIKDDLDYLFLEFWTEKDIGYNVLVKTLSDRLLEF